MAKNLFLLGKLIYNEKYGETARQMLTNVQQDVHKNIYFYSNWGIVEAYFTRQPYEVAIVGKDYKPARTEIDRHYLPNVLLLGGKSEGSLELLANKLIKGQTTIYVCRDKICKMPVTKVSEALEQLK